MDFKVDYKLEGEWSRTFAVVRFQENGYMPDQNGPARSGPFRPKND